MSEATEELVQFLDVNARQDLKMLAITQTLGLTADEAGLQLLITTPVILRALIKLMYDKHDSIAKDAALSLVNISANVKGSTAVIDLNENIVAHCIDFILNPDSYIADVCAMILSNLSRQTQHMNGIVKGIEESKLDFDRFINAFTKVKYNNRGNNLHYLGPVLSNLSQIPLIRGFILDENKAIMQKLITFTDYQESVIRRGGVIGTLKNCCFDTSKHSWLLSDQVDILPRLLLPLAGNNEFDDEDNDKLPLDLQFLPEDKVREEDPDIRCILLEAITQLCALKANREFIRDKNAYVILRELHKWEKNKKALLACENLVDILIRTEEEISEDNLKSLDIPTDLQEKFDKMTKEEENEAENQNDL